MKNMIIILLTTAITVGSIAARVREGIRIERPMVIQVENKHEQVQSEIITQPEAIPTFPPLPLATPQCEVFVDKDCFTDMRMQPQ